MEDNQVRAMTLNTIDRKAGLNGSMPADGALLTEAYDRIAAGAPANMHGLDYVRYLATELARLSEMDRTRTGEIWRGFIEKMVQLDASDLDMGAESCNGMVWLRVDGLKRAYPELGQLRVSESDLLLLSMLTPPQQQRLLENFSVDFGYGMGVDDSHADLRFRGTIFFDNKRLALNLRMLPSRPRPLSSYGLHPMVERGMLFRHVRDGITLITGVTGSGKSSTLDAIVDANNDDIEGEIIIIAQPLEYIHTSRKCVVRHREVGTDVSSFVDGMVQALRQDPDIVVVGEMRDPESIWSAFEMADTGHKVFSTLHTCSAVESIDRIVAEYPTNEQDRIRNRMADVLTCIISQKLMPAVGGGRILAKEILWMTSPARAAIKNKNTGEIYQMMWAGADSGMITLEQDLYRLVNGGKITPETAISYANNKRRLMQLMNQA